MGVCVSRSSAIPPTASHPDLERLNSDQVSSPDNEIISLQDISDAISEDATTRKSVFAAIDPTVPDTFFPLPASNSSLEEVCSTIFRKIAPKGKDEQCRHRTETLLQQWRKSNVLSEIESHVLAVNAIQCTAVQELANALTNPAAKYIKSISNSDPFYLEVATAYAVFFWVANNIKYSQSTWMSFLKNPENVKSSITPDSVLKSRKSISIGYVKLFCGIATAAGLKAHIVSGTIKAPRSQSPEEIGDDCNPNKLSEHHWNAVS